MCKSEYNWSCQTLCGILAIIGATTLLTGIPTLFVFLAIKGMTLIAVSLSSGFVGIVGILIGYYIGLRSSDRNTIERLLLEKVGHNFYSSQGVYVETEEAKKESI